MKTKNINFLLLFLFFKNYSEEFIYPIITDNKSKIYLIHKTSQKFYELLIYDAKFNQIKNKINLWIENLFDIQLLPNMQGLSFFNNGFLKIKYFENDMLYSINFPEPIYNSSSIQWINSDIFYFSAKKGNQSFIAQMNVINNEIEIFEEDDVNDILYPQKIDSEFFYIEKHIDNNFRTPKIYYKIFVSDCATNNKIKKIIFDFGQNEYFF